MLAESGVQGKGVLGICIFVVVFSCSTCAQGRGAARSGSGGRAVQAPHRGLGRVSSKVSSVARVATKFTAKLTPYLVSFFFCHVDAWDFFLTCSRF